MSKVRVFVGTKKGAFILKSDGLRKNWQINGPLFGGWEIYHIKGSPIEPNTIYASQANAWFGQVIHRSMDGGLTWNTVGNEFHYEGGPMTHQDFDGTQQPWKFTRIWHLEPSLTDPTTIYAGAEDAALFRSTDSGLTWQELPNLRKVKGDLWQPGAGGMCLHSILLNPQNPERIYVAISAAGVFRTDDNGETWKPINEGLRSPYELPDPDAEVGHCVHSIAHHPSRPEVLFMQKHWDVMRSDDAGESWVEVSGNLPSDFGYPIAVHSHEPETIYVIPIKSDSEHYFPEGRLCVYRSRVGGVEWQALAKGLPQKDCYHNVLRDAMAVDTLDPCGIYFGTTGGQVYASADSGDTWEAIAQNLPKVLSVEVQTLS